MTFPSVMTDLMHHRIQALEDCAEGFITIKPVLQMFSPTNTFNGSLSTSWDSQRWIE